MSLKFSKASLERVLDEIENKSEFYFLYNQDIVNTKKVVDLDVKEEKIEEVLNTLFVGTNIKYTISERQIVLTNSENQSGLNFPSGQQKSVSGKVTDTTGAPLPGVSVVVKGTTTGTITDFDGNFSLNNFPQNATLLFSFVGMKTQEISVGNKTSISIVMEDETVGIDEVVAIGYGTVRKKDLTGAVASIGTKSIKDLPISHPRQALHGQIAGVDVKQ